MQAESVDLQPGFWLGGRDLVKCTMGQGQAHRAQAGQRATLHNRGSTIKTGLLDASICTSNWLALYSRLVWVFSYVKVQ